MQIDSRVIKNHLDKKVLTQTEFAVMAGLGRATLSGVLSRETAAKSTVLKLAKALNVEPGELIKKGE